MVKCISLGRLRKITVFMFRAWVSKGQPSVRSIRIVKCAVRSCYDRYSLSNEQQLRTACILRKQFWPSSTFRTRNIHIFLPVRSCYDRYSLSIEHQLRTTCILRKQFWCSSTFRTKNIHIFLPIRFCYDRYSLSIGNNCEPCILRKHFWCSSTFRTKNIHIYLVCFCRHILDAMNEEYTHTKKAFLVFVLI